MKWILPLMLISLFYTGCQNFRYYDPAKPHRGKNQFYNNYDNSPKPSFLRWQWERWTTQKDPEPEFHPEVIKTDTTFLKANRNQTTFTWIGHASALLQINGLNILIDPVFSERVSPVHFLGPKRLVPVPFPLTEMPSLDVVLISHSHYDHLDLPTLTALAKDHPKAVFLVPLGNAELLVTAGIHPVQEKDWWEDQTVKGVRLSFVPSQHWAKRSLFDTNKSLWGGWVVQSADFKFYYSGDTGYSKDFRDIHAKFGDMDLAMIPVGAYEPRWFMRQQHVNPEEALKIHEDVHSKTSVGVHWGTFRLSDEAMLKPYEEITALLKNRPSYQAPVDFRLLKHGETLRLR